MSSAYCTSANINTVYGATNVANWADIDNDGDAGTKAARITYAIDVASEDIDDVLRTLTIRVPIVTSANATPKTIEHLAAVLAGLWLYECRGATDFSRDGMPHHGLGWRRQWAEEKLERIRTGKVKLDDVIGN